MVGSLALVASKAVACVLFGSSFTSVGLCGMDDCLDTGLDAVGFLPLLFKVLLMAPQSVGRLAKE